MNVPDWKKMRDLLLDRKQQLESLDDTGREAAKTVELDQSRVGRLSRMDAMQGQAMSQEAGRRRELELQKIETALHRLEAGDYGYCLRCGEMINPARLAVDPAATLCIECAENRN